MSKKPSTFSLLQGRYPSPEYVLIQEVSDASGHARSRSLDFMAIGMWNSRGLAIHGIEEKSWRNDWLKELKNPAKQENHFKFCDYFWLLTTEGDVAKLEEIPPSWGWMHVMGSRIKTMKEAPKLTPVICSRTFMCAMMRRAACKEKYVLRESIEEQLEEARKGAREVEKRSHEYSLSEYNKLLKSVKEFETAAGIKVEKSWQHDPVKTGAAVKLFLEGGVEKYQKELESLREKAEKIVSNIGNILNIPHETNHNEHDNGRA